MAGCGCDVVSPYPRPPAPTPDQWDRPPTITIPLDLNLPPPVGPNGCPIRPPLEYPTERPKDPLMHAPGYEKAHKLKPAGIASQSGDMFRFNLVRPGLNSAYPWGPDDERPVCPVEPVNNCNHLMEAAGKSLRLPGDVFRFHQVRPNTDDSQERCGRTRYLGQGLDCSENNPEPFSTTCKSQQDPRCRRPPSNCRCKHGHHQVARLPQLTSYLPSSVAATAGSSCPSCLSEASRNQTGIQSAGQFAINKRSATLPCMWLGPRSGGLQAVTPNVGPFYPPDDVNCPTPYVATPYACRMVYDRDCLRDCPEQDGPPADSYTFL